MHSCTRLGCQSCEIASAGARVHSSKNCLLDVCQGMTDAWGAGAQLACPICMKSYADLAPIWRRVDEEVAATPMPADYAHWVAHILCNDCNQVGLHRARPFLITLPKFSWCCAMASPLKPAIITYPYTSSPKGPLHDVPG